VTHRVPAVFIAALLLAISACRSGPSLAAVTADSVEVARRTTRLAGSLARPESAGASDAVLARWLLPEGLAEISGLALTPDGRLFAHDDEQGRISEIDYRSGVVVKQFIIGKQALHADFEGITVVGNRLYLLASDGTLYEFPEGARDARVAHTVHDTHLGKECEFEGLAYDAGINALLLSCKRVGTKRLEDMLVIYRWRLKAGDGGQLSTLTVPLALAIGGNGWKTLHPSDITVDPTSGNYVLVAAQEQALVEITPDGAVVASRPLPEGLQHTEGVAITRDSLLILSDEAGNRPATISLYRWR
jgi:uncharacterized protein YjiK